MVIAATFIFVDRPLLPTDGVQFIHGLQNGSAGAPPAQHYQIIATAKHYMGYDMTSGNCNISDRWASEYYLPQ